jgi:formate-dependent nitrite reductase membrane component NrfD
VTDAGVARTPPLTPRVQATPGSAPPADPAARPRAPYGRRTSAELGQVPPDTPTPTYYGLPALKRSHYRWLIVSYFFVGGLAGAAQLIATVFDRAGTSQDRSVVRCGRHVALVGSLIAPLLLIKDLHTPTRWYNMLRIFRPTSPMSIGSWTLAGFGALSGLAAMCQALDDLGAHRFRRVATLAGVPAAGLGMLMSVYTGVLLSATSTPLWSVAYRQLPALFGATAFASASAAVSLILTAVRAPRPPLERLDRLAFASAAAQLALALSAEREWKARRVAGPLEAADIRPVHRLVVLGLGIVAPLIVHGAQLLTRRHSRSIASLAAAATLVGAYAERAVIVFAGNRSADRAEDYFTASSPRGVP